MRIQHETCVCALDEHELAMRDERERLAEVASKWLDEVNAYHGTDFCIDGMFEDDWFPMTPTCKLELND
jgi:hypothetical protein